MKNQIKKIQMELPALKAKLIRELKKVYPYAYNIYEIKKLKNRIAELESIGGVNNKILESWG